MGGAVLGKCLFFCISLFTSETRSPYTVPNQKGNSETCSQISGHIFGQSSKNSDVRRRSKFCIPVNTETRAS